MRIFILAACLSALPLVAQEAKTTYQAEFVFHEQSSAKPASEDRRYAFTLDSNGNGYMRMGRKIPVQTAGATQYLDVGVNINCRLRDGRDNSQQLYVEVELSALQNENSSSSTPVIRQRKINAAAVVTPGKAAKIASVHDPETKELLDIQVTLTRVD